MLSALLLSFGMAIGGIASPPSVTQEALVPGIIDFDDDRNRGVLTAPASVGVREDFQVTINTFGGGCEREGDTSVIMSATGATLIVYDITAATRPDVICTAVVKRLPHIVALRFEKPGEALIRVWGRRVGPETPPLGVPFVLEHRVTVK
jgi:hypothetical protein